MRRCPACGLARDPLARNSAPPSAAAWRRSPRHTDRANLLEVGERRVDGSVQAWAAGDPRRVRHLMKWTIATHVVRIVRGDAEATTLADARPGSGLGLAPVGHRLGWSR